jgi:hypothetical protein
MKQTAVELFEAHLIEYGFDLSLHKIEIDKFKEMEKEYITDAYYDGSQDLKYKIGSAEQYYTKTFKTK